MEDIMWGLLFLKILLEIGRASTTKMITLAIQKKVMIIFPPRNWRAPNFNVSKLIKMMWGIF